MFDFYDATTVITLITLFITIADAFTNRIISSNKKIKVIILCLLIALVSVCEWAGVRCDGAAPELIQLHYAAKYIKFSVTPFVGLAAANAYGKTKGQIFVVALLSVNAFIQFVSLWTGWIFYVDANNVYHRCAFYLVYVAFFIISIAYCITCIIIGNKQYRFRIDFTQILAIILIAVGIIIQMLCSSIRIDFLCIAVGNFMLYTCYGNAIMRLDALTKLFNRRCYEINLQTAPEKYAILFFDVNDFKRVNDDFGHKAGDECLQKIAAAIFGVYASFGSCFRIGGDEFCVIMHKNLQNIEQLNAEFFDEIDALRKDDKRIPLVALGYALREESDKSVDATVSRADEMMYAVKKPQKDSESL